jgi:hypothetical protein
MERVLLLATREGLSSSFVTQALEWTDLRWPLRDPISGTGYAQMLLRLGLGPKAPAHGGARWRRFSISSLDRPDGVTARFRVRTGWRTRR